MFYSVLEVPYEDVAVVDITSVMLTFPNPHQPDWTASLYLACSLPGQPVGQSPGHAAKPSFSRTVPAHHAPCGPLDWPIPVENKLFVNNQPYTGLARNISGPHLG